MLLSQTLTLKAEPAGNLHSLDELFALADAMEKEAVARYSELAVEMQRQNKPDVAAVFTRLAAAEREHVDSVTRWSQSRRGKAPDPALVRWQAPEALDNEAEAEIKASRLVTPYRALAIAVRNEERAFAFWTYVAAFADDSEIKQAAETMAREELGHVAILRKERRRAYHEEHDAARRHARDEAAAGRGTVQIDASALERRLAGHLMELAGRLDGAPARRVHELLEQTDTMSAEARGIGRFPASLEQSDAQSIAEALTDAYLESAERTSDARRLDALQALSERAIARLAWLRSLDPAGA
jgi:rubrerythrin